MNQTFLPAAHRFSHVVLFDVAIEFCRCVLERPPHFLPIALILPVAVQTLFRREIAIERGQATDCRGELLPREHQLLFEQQAGIPVGLHLVEDLDKVGALMTVVAARAVLRRRGRRTERVHEHRDIRVGPRRRFGERLIECGSRSAAALARDPVEVPERDDLRVDAGCPEQVPQREAFSRVASLGHGAAIRLRRNPENQSLRHDGGLEPDPEEIRSRTERNLLPRG